MLVKEVNVFGRLKRHYAKQGLLLKKCQEGKWFHTTGRYGLVDAARNYWVDYHIDLEQRARDEGILSPAENMV